MDTRTALADYYKRSGANVHGALDNHLAVLRFLKSDEGHWYQEAVEISAHRSGEALYPNEETARFYGNRMADKIADGLDRAQTVWVDRDMTDVIEAAARALPDGDTLHETDLFVPAGFVQFARPITVTWEHPIDHHGFDTDLIAVAWFPSMTTVPADDTDPHSMVVNAADRKVQGVMAIFYVATPNLEVVATPLIPADITAIAFDKYTSYTSHGADDITRQLIIVLNRLMWQKIASITPLRPPRAAQRRLERVRPPEYGQTWVMHLRRLAERIEHDPDHVPIPANYTHRFLVRGHWRNQYYPSLNDHRLIWIDTFIKGPEDAPLVVTDRLISFDR